MRSTQRRLLAMSSWHIYLPVVVVLGLAEAGLLITQAVLFARVVAVAFWQHPSLADLHWPLIGLAAALAGRGLLVWVTGVGGQIQATRVRRRLRLALARRVLAMGSTRLAAESHGQLATLLTEGVEVLDAFYGRYLPQLMMAVAVPTAILIWVMSQDWVSGVIMLVTLPLVPVFMLLIGLGAREATQRRWQAMSRLGGHFLDVVRGLPTLRLFGRERSQEEVVAQVTDRLRRTTMATLRVAFLSSLVLELAATVSTALVAVAIGLRLDQGTMSLETGLGILVLTPEVYLPLRRLGSQFHASMEALSPAQRILALLDEMVPAADGDYVPDLNCDPICLEQVSVGYDRGLVLQDLDLRIEPGDRVLLVGPSGSGKSTLLRLLLGLVTPTQGRLTIGGRPAEEVSWEKLRTEVGWVSQRPYLFAGTVAETVRWGKPGATDAEVTGVLQAVGLDLPPETQVGEGGKYLSAGQRQRLALARALVRQPRLLLLDEPAAHLDVDAQERLGRLLANLPSVTVVMAAHHLRCAAWAGRVVRLGGVAATVEAA